MALGTKELQLHSKGVGAAFKAPIATVRSKKKRTSESSDRLFIEHGRPPSVGSEAAAPFSEITRGSSR